MNGLANMYFRRNEKKKRFIFSETKKLIRNYNETEFEEVIYRTCSETDLLDLASMQVALDKK